MGDCSNRSQNPILILRKPKTKNQKPNQTTDETTGNHFKMSLQGKNIIITGATSGIGVQLATTLSKAGASVFIGGRRADRGEQVAKDTNTTFYTIDVSDESSNEQFFDAAEKYFGGPQTVDFVLLNAGVEGNGTETMVTDLKVETYDLVYNTNVRGVILGLKYGTPLLRPSGTFVVTSSVGSVLPFGMNPIYASSKAALDSLVRSYGAQFQESKDERIRSLSIVGMNPTLYMTDMADRFTGNNADVREGMAKMVNPSQRAGKPEELADLILQFVHGDLPYHNGDSFTVDADTHFPLTEYFGRIAEATA